MMNLSKIKAVHVSTVHKYDDTRILHRECKALAEAGCDVKLIIPHCKAEFIHDVEIILVKKPSWLLARLFTSVPKVFFKLLKFEKTAVIHLHDPELIPAGLLLRLFARTVIYDMHEDFPAQIHSKEYLPEFIKKPLSFIVKVFERIFLTGFSGIITVTEPILQRLPERKSTLVQNFPVNSEIEPGKEAHRDRERIIFYVGDITKPRGLTEMLDAVSISGPEKKARLVLAGRFSPPRTRDEAELHPGWEFTDFIGWADRKQLNEMLKKSRIGMLTLHPYTCHLVAQPVKLFEYMLAGIPVISSDFPMYRKTIEDAQCGLLVDPLNPKEIAEAVNYLLDHPDEAEEMGRKGRAAVLEKYIWENEARELVSFYQKMSRR